MPGRRLQLIDESDQAALGRLQAAAWDVLGKSYAAALACLGRRDQAGIDDAVDRVHDVAAHALEALGDEPIVPECGRGCSACCHVPVSLTPPLVLRLWGAVRADVATLTAAAAAARYLSQHEQAAEHLPCPLLEGADCSVYAVRPAPCRRYVSADRAKCESGLLTREPVMIPMGSHSLAIYATAEVGLTAAGARLGLDTEPVDFRLALALCATNHAVAARWLDGSDVFEAARPSDKDDRASMRQTYLEALLLVQQAGLW